MREPHPLFTMIPTPSELCIESDFHLRLFFQPVSFFISFFILRFSYFISDLVFLNIVVI